MRMPGFAQHSACRGKPSQLLSGKQTPCSFSCTNREGDEGQCLLLVPLWPFRRLSVLSLSPQSSEGTLTTVLRYRENELQPCTVQAETLLSKAAPEKDGQKFMPGCTAQQACVPSGQVGSGPQGGRRAVSQKWSSISMHPYPHAANSSTPPPTSPSTWVFRIFPTG